MMYLIPGFPADSRSRPNDDLPRQVKESTAHGLDVAKWLYSMYRSNNTIIKAYEQDQILTNRNYSYGRQDMSIYEKRWDSPTMPVDGNGATSNDAPSKSSFERLNVSRLGKDNINFKQPLNPLPKFMSAMIGVLADQEVDISCEAIDERSTSLRQELEFGGLVDSMFAPTTQYMQMTMEMGSPPDMAPKPSTMEELEMWKKVGTFKLGYEAAAKDAWTETERLSDNGEVKEDVARDLLTIGKSVCYIYDVDGLVKYECKDITDVIMEDTKKSINRDPSYFAFLKYLTLTEVRAKCPWISDDEAKKFIKDFGNERGLFDNGPTYGTQRRDSTYLFESTKIPVLYFWSKTIDFDYNTNVSNEDGSTDKYSEPYRFRKGVGDIVNWKPEYIDWRDQEGKPGQVLKPREYKGRGKRSTEVNSERNVLCGAWIMGTPHLLEYGYQQDLAFDYFSRNALIPAVSFKLEGVSYVERVIPILDEIEMTFIQIQDTLATTPPPGIAIDWKSMSSVPADNGKFVHPFDMITIGEKTKRWIYTISPPDPHNPGPLNQKPISEVMTGLPDALKVHIEMMDYWYKELERQGGISDFLTGGSPADRQGLGVSQIVLQTNNNTLKPIFNGWTSMKERIANFAILKIQSLVWGDDDRSSPYFQILGAGKYAALKSAGGHPPVMWGISMIKQVSDLVKQEIYKLVEAGMGLGKDGVPQIQMGPALFIFDKLQKGNISDVRMYIEYIQKKKEEEAIQQEQARQQQQTALAAQLDAQKTQNQKDIDNNKSDNVLKQLYLKHIIQLEANTHQHILGGLANTQQSALNQNENAQQSTLNQQEATHEAALQPESTSTTT